jgi:transcriptional regulator with XRE-family HTH domain
VHTSTPPLVPATPVLTGLGQALRWLRERQARKQYRVADDAGVTKGMLSAYETGRQRPSLETLDKLLETLGCDLNDLHNALQIVNGRPERMKSWQLRDGTANDHAHAHAHAHADAEPQGFSHLRQTGPGLDERAAAQAPAGRGILVPARAASRQGPAYAAMPGFGILAQPGGTRSGMPLAGEVRETGRGRLTSELHRLLGLAGDEQAPDSPLPELPELPEEEELALTQMLEGFHSLLRYWHRCLAALSPHDPRDPREAHEAQEPPEAAEPPSPPGGTPAPAGPTSEAEERGGLDKRGSGSGSSGSRGKRQD